jgi:hypothetical protein
MRELKWTILVVALAIVLATEGIYCWRASSRLPQKCPRCDGDMSTWRDIAWCTRCDTPPWQHLVEQPAQPDDCEAQEGQP